MLFVWIPANAGSWHDQKNEVKSTKQLYWREKKTLYLSIILAMSVPALVKQWFEVGEHRYEVVRYDGSKARPKGLMKVVKWATIESNAALAISNGGQIITVLQARWRPSPQTMVCAPSSSGSTCLGGQKRERNRTKLRRRPRRQPGRHARAGVLVRGPSGL